MTDALREELLRLPAAERLELLEELWDSLDDDEPALALTACRRKLLTILNAIRKTHTPWHA
jgi:putative addiction module component (TIGR02574 family)